MILKKLISFFRCVWLRLELNSAGHRPSRTEVTALLHSCTHKELKETEYKNRYSSLTVMLFQPVWLSFFHGTHRKNFWRILVAPCSYKEWGLRFHKAYWKYMIKMLHSLCFQVIPNLWEGNKSKCKSLFVVNLPVQRADSMIPTQEPDHLQMNHSFVYWIKCFAEKLWLKWFVHIAGIATFVMNTECATTLYFCLIKEFRLEWLVQTTILLYFSQ